MSIRVWWFLVILVVLAFVCGFLVVLVVLVVFSRAPLGHAPPSDVDGCGILLVVFGSFWWFLVVVLVCFRQAPRGSLGYPLSFPLTSIRFPQLLVLVVFGCGFWCFWWFWWFWVVLPWVTPYRQIVLVARGCDGFVFVVCGFLVVLLAFGGAPLGPPPLL
jgi:hypothetical protein